MRSPVFRTLALLAPLSLGAAFGDIPETGGCRKRGPARYRFYIQTGKLEIRDIEAAWHDYAEPPEVRIISQ